MTHRLRRPVALFVVTTALAACPRPEDDDEPALPPSDTMTFFELKEGAKSAETTGQALTVTAAAADTSNVKLAIAAVGLVTAGVNLALLWPRTFIAGVVSTRPTRDGDAWVWKRTFPLLGWDANLRGSIATGRLATEMRVTGLKPNQEHGFHVHEKGDCSSGDAMSAGGHLNPSGKPHGPPSGEHHAGDLPALKADGAGSATIDTRVRGLAGGPSEFAGKALVVHLSPDDYTTQPTGNSGARIACGVIAATPPRDAGGQPLAPPRDM